SATLPVPVRYALRFCDSHFPDGTPVEAIIDDPKINPRKLNAMMSCSIDNHALFWSATTGQLTSPQSRPKVTIPNSDTGVPARIECIAVSPNGTRIATCSSYSSVQRGAIHIWDATALELIASCELDANPGSAVFSQDGERVAMTDVFPRRLGTVHVFNIKTNSCVQESREELKIDALAFSLDGSLELVCTELQSTPQSKKAIVRWTLGGPPRPKLEQSDNLKKVYSISISPDCKEIIAVTDAHTLVWDFEKSTLIHKLPTQPGVRSAVMSNDWDTMVLDAISSSYIGNIKPFKSWKEWAHRADGRGIRLSPKKDDLHAILSWSHKDIRLHSTFTLPEVLLHLDFSTVYPDPEFSCDGEHVFVPTVSHIEKMSIPQCYFKGKTHLKVEWTAFSPDGKYHLSADSEGVFLLHDHSSGQTACLDSSHEIRVAAFSHNASRIVGVSRDGNIHLWDTTTHALIGKSRNAALDDVTYVSFGANDEEIIVRSLDMREAHTTLRVVIDGTLIALQESVNDAGVPLPPPTYIDTTVTARTHVSTEAAPNHRLETIGILPRGIHVLDSDDPFTMGTVVYTNIEA
ncbi:hypothetical protein H0H93_009094, partial [Arthromyces matolae]